MPQFREDFWEQLEELERKRAEVQAEHDEALQKLFASRDRSSIAPPEIFDEYSVRADALDDAATAIREFRKRFTPYK